MKTLTKFPAKILLLFLTLQVYTLNATGLTLEQKLNDLNQLISIIKSGYGPLQYKKEVLGIDVNQLKEKYTQLIEQTQTDSEFHYFIVQMVSEFQDGHFYALIPSADYAYIDKFQTAWVDGKILVDQLSPSSRFQKNPIKRGDEVIAINGVHISEIIEDLAKYVSSGNEQSRKAQASAYLFYRPAFLYPMPKSEDHSITVTLQRPLSPTKPPPSEKKPEHEKPPEPLVWEVEARWIIKKAPPPHQQLKSNNVALEPIDQYVPRPFSRSKAFDNLSVHLPLTTPPPFTGQKNTSYACSGSTRIKIPPRAKVIIERPFVAYYHPTEKGNIGYLRLPHYSPSLFYGSDNLELFLEQYRFVVDTLEKNTVGLVIDQDHNCGGYVYLLDKMLSLFMTKPYPSLQFSLLANRNTYIELASLLRATVPHTFNQQGLEKITNLVYDSWQAEEFMTPLTSLDGRAFSQPDPLHYTKPVLVLANMWSGSAGDAFPAMLKGHGRAKVFGSQTMGLGGHVEPQPSLNFSGIQVIMTKSLFYHPDQTPVENNGVIPDFPYLTTREDMLNRYQDYQQAYLKEILKMVSQAQEREKEKQKLKKITPTPYLSYPH